MRTMGIAELKALLPETIAHVKGGEEILVTEDDQPVARLGPPSAASPAAAYEALVLIRRPEKPLDEAFWKLKRPTWRGALSERSEERELREAV